MTAISGFKYNPPATLAKSPQGENCKRMRDLAGFISKGEVIAQAFTSIIPATIVANFFTHTDLAITSLHVLT